MKKSLRFASAALAVALAASCAAPAFAAGGSSFTKSETVYAVMNADGSIQSTTVSEHVYSASGLSKVTDQSTLTNIQNTESSAEFTQDGEKLVWNTDDTDVYYKGDTTRALPIQATVTYALDGQEAALEDLIGKSGHLTMTIALKNNETGTVNVNGTDRTIVTPLVTAVGVIFGQDATNVVAAHGLVESAAKSNVAAFVTLPGVKDSLSGLLPNELDTIEDYLQDTITVEADVTGLTCPQVMMACATNAAALGTDNVFDLNSINDLTDGINQLNDAMSQLLDGASQLEDGTSQLASGVLALLDGANTLNNGAAALDEGLGQLTNGLDTLSSNNSALNSGAQQVADGVLASANKTLKEGGLIDTDMTWDNYAAVIDNILTMNDKTLAAGRRKMVRTIWEQAPSFKDSQLDLALYLSATKTNHDLEAALHLMQNYDPSMLCGLVQLLTSQEAKDTAKAELKYQVQNVQAAAGIFLCDGDHQTQVRLGELVLRFLIPLGDPLCQLHLFLGGKELDLADLLEVHPHRVVQAVLGGQVNGVNQFFLVKARQIDIVVRPQVEIVVPQIQFQIGGDHLNIHGVQTVVNVLDLFRRQLHLLQLGVQVGGTDHAVLLRLRDERLQCGMNIVHIGFWSLLRRTTTHRESPFFYVKIHKTLVPLNYTPFFSVRQGHFPKIFLSSRTVFP